MSPDLEERLRRYGRLLDQAAERTPAPEKPASLPRRRPGRPLLAAAAAAAVATVAMAGVGLLDGESGYQVRVAGEGDGGSASLERGPDGSFPHIVVEGWRVTRADESAGVMSDDSSKRYHHAEALFARKGAELELTMDEGDRAAYDALVADRAASADQRRQTSVLGYPAIVTRYTGSQRYAAMWFVDHVVYELDGDVGGEPAFMDALDRLRVVDDETWEAALPDSSVAPRERAAEVDRMLADIPQPPGFDATPLRRAKAAVDRYQLGAKVAGSVACAWIDRWTEARREGDRAAEREAVEAMATSRKWRVLEDMSAEGDYPEVVWEVADAMASDGHIEGGRRMSVGEAAPDALGCPR
jgi:hypothetical protein